MLKEFLAQSSSNNGQARHYAFNNTVELSNLIPPTVSYESQGALLVIADKQNLDTLKQQFSSLPSVTFVTPIGTQTTGDLKPYFFASAELTGYLGRFSLTISQQDSLLPIDLAQIAIGQSHFDMVLDLGAESLMDTEVPAVGYFPVGRGYPKLEDATEEIQSLIGTFDKPKFFRLDTDKCAHSSRGVKGCERCVLSCPAGALSSEGRDETGYKIEINPYLCQGVGTCATSCPTGAIEYALPYPNETQAYIERTLQNYHQQGGENPIILFCSEEHETYNLMALRVLPDNVIPIVVNELPSVGIDTWFSALTNGASQVLFAASRRMPATIIRVLNEEVSVAQTLLHQLGINAASIDILYLEDLRSAKPNLIEQPNSLMLGELEGDKRARLFQSLDALAEAYPIMQPQMALPSNAPYGTVDCDTDKCTLCMACVAVCPTMALHNEGQLPMLSFIEQDCVQCGLCEGACPEDALNLTPRMNWDQQARQSALTINKDEPALCLSCQKPFAPKSMISMLQTKLKDHSHFNNEVAIRRIAMCEDCRVVDIYDEMAKDPTKQLKY
ncbi:(Fe-S)-binding protein [Vibrio sp. UCD-FRSSP16_10]|uniref:4Fe-4S binding protein n=1 Tax=unclassified Vibrio TaxID=2614977 RepID=UPI0008021366|nr:MULTISPECIES: 4Fe-4S binding protein [unclassified Vibrio]OBT13397.1 (Fe-S)-binding protein [Vibrio sp. UCD-FRSSP16_10]OBT17907.1 (Fe-S)-binding protein [Vibrio sp. UCD-FRSSP16_30]